MIINYHIDQCKLLMRKRWRKDRTDIAVFSMVVIAKTGVSVRTPPTIVGRKSWLFFAKTMEVSNGIN